MSHISDVTYRKLATGSLSHTMVFKYYEIWYQNRIYHILIPDDISQLWIIHYPYMDKFTGMNVDWIGNKKGFEAMIHACDILSRNNNFIIYFPCKKNTQFPHHYFERPAPDCGDQFVDLVLMKPNSLKISDWKEIRRRIPKTKAQEWKTEFIHKNIDSYMIPKYNYRKDHFLKEIFRFDTVFYLTPWHGYFRWISILEKFLRPDIEDIFLEDISACSDRLRGECIDYFIHGLRHKERFTGEIGMVFWDNDIEKAAKVAAK